MKTKKIKLNFDPGNAQEANFILYSNYFEKSQRQFAANETQHAVVQFDSPDTCPLLGVGIANNSGVGTAEVISSIAIGTDPNLPNTRSVYIYWHNTMSVPWAINVNVTLMLFFHQY